MRVLLAACLLLTPAQDPAQDPTSRPASAPEPSADEAARARALLERMAVRWKELDSMRCSFTWSVRTPVLRRPITSSGTVVFRREPALAVFDITKPRPSKSWFDGRSYTVLRPDDRTAERYLFSDGAIGAALARLLTPGAAEIGSALQVTSFAARDGATEIGLRPAGGAERYVQSVALTIDDERLVPTRIRYVNREGDEVTIALADIEIDPALEPAAFAQELPAGTRLRTHDLADRR